MITKEMKRSETLKFVKFDELKKYHRLGESREVDAKALQMEVQECLDSKRA